MFKRKKYDHKIYPDEIFLDSKNISGFDTSQFEGRLEKPIGKKTFIYVGALIGFLGLFLLPGYFIYKSLKGKNLPPEASGTVLKRKHNSFKGSHI